MDLGNMERGVSVEEDREAYAEGAAFVEGRLVPVAEARVPILNWVFALGCDL